MAMRYLVLSAIVSTWMAVGSPVQAQTPDPQIMAPITRFMDAFNKGDVAGAAATHLADADLAILDEVPPYQWRGPQAFQTWAADLERDDKKHGISDESVVLGPPTRVETDGATAYVVVPATYNIKQQGVAMREAAQMTFSLKKTSSGWMIHGWTWTGPRPSKVEGTARK
jgi:ketosteroid isomerase-like protein